MIKECLHNKRAATEKHIRQLQQNGQEGVRYTAMMPDIPFLVLGLLCDAGWITHLIAGCLYFRERGFQSALDWLLLAALVGMICGVVYIMHTGLIHEKEIATRRQKNLGFGLAVYAGLAGGMIGIIRAVLYTAIPSTLIWMIVGGLVNFTTGLPIYLSFRKGIVYGVQ